jgi:hypothetical protein
MTYGFATVNMNPGVVNVFGIVLMIAVMIVGLVAMISITIRIGRDVIAECRKDRERQRIVAEHQAAVRNIHAIKRDAERRMRQVANRGVIEGKSKEVR